MKPKPLSALNPFTVRVAISSSPLSQHATTRPRQAALNAFDITFDGRLSAGRK
jgi:hypothetical protein